MATLYTQKVKNILKILFLISIFFAFVFTFSTVSAESIDDFSANIIVSADSSISVQEKIIYNFGEEDKHGIFRTIPLRNYKNEKTKISEISVKDELGVDYLFSTSYSNGELSIKIGDPDETISGIKEYNINYRVSGAMGYFENYDEIYWNITGNDWPVNINKVNATVILPDNIIPIQQSCYVGAFGSNSKCDALVSGNEVSASADSLLSGEGITLAVGFPKGVVYEPTQADKNKALLKENIILILPIIVFIIMFLFWRKNGRDPKGLGTIMAEYEPPEKMKPTLVGSLVDGRVDNRDITAGLIYLAEQGFIKINRIEKTWILGQKDYELEVVKNDILSLDKTEQEIFNLFFKDLTIGEKFKISSLKSDRTFFVKYKSVTNSIYQEMADKGFYEKNPVKAKIPYIIAAVIFGVFFMFIFLTPNPASIIALILSEAFIIIFGVMMSKKTKLGAENKSHILGFKHFLSMTEKDRLDFHNAPERKPEEFMEFLPYAIALGVEKKWAKQFEGIYLPQPNWYHSSVAGSFVAADFASHMAGFSQSFGASAGSGSTGGGSSGGGGGGGGGGSW